MQYFFIKIGLKLSHFCKKKQNFWARPQTAVPLEEQNQVLSSLIQISQKHNSTPNAAYPTKMSKSTKYFLVGQKPENQVCMSMLLIIFSISHKKVKMICSNKATVQEWLLVIKEENMDNNEKFLKKPWIA